MKLQFEKNPPPGRIPASDWYNWKWQLRKGTVKPEEFSDYLKLTEFEEKGFTHEVFNIRSTPYYLKLAAESEPIRRMVVPTVAEQDPSGQQLGDPLAENQNQVTPRVIHRYPDRVLFLVTDMCGIYCRYCTRKHFTGKEQFLIREDEYQRGLSYIREHQGIREVILSGGDPLTLSDAKIKKILFDLRAIPHVEIIRIGTRMPVVNPMRISDELVETLKAFQPVFLMTHFNHPREVTEEAKTALLRLVDNGLSVYNQMVLLNGVNNDAAVVQALCRRLLFLRVKPYYMFLCDPSPGTGHLRIPVSEAEKIQRELWGSLSGLAMPSLSLDIPGGGGKAGIVPNFESHRSVGLRSFVGFDGVSGEYRDPMEPSVVPADAKTYKAEWEATRAAKQEGVKKIQPSHLI